MALTTTQKAQVRLYLGFSDMSRTTPTHWRLESMLSGSLSSEGETVVVDLLTKLATVDTDLATVSSSSRAGIIEVDNGGVKWASNGMSASSSIQARGRMLVNRLARTLGVEPFADVFSAGSVTSGGSMGIAGRG